MTQGTDIGGAPRGKTLGFWLTSFLDWSAACVLFGLMVLTFTDVIWREVFNEPFAVTTDLTRLLLAAMVYTVLPSVSRLEQHVAVDLLDRWTPDWAVRPRQFAINLISALIFALMAWQIALIAIDKFEIGELTQFVEWPIAPIFALMAILSGLTALGLLYTAISYLVGKPPAASAGSKISFE
ncbi:MAG: TRAP transporter small permease [Alphaproteobacteria bacterium]